MNPDLAKERQNASFDPIHLSYVLEGSPEATKKRMYISNLVEQDNICGDEDIAFMNHEERYEFCLKKELLISRRLKELNLSQDDANLYELLSFGPIFRGSSLHKIAFVSAIKSLASEEQKARWLPMIEKGLMYGSYAQTEISHGSHVRGLETTAEYDAKSKEFVLNTPHLTSIKCWPGNLGKSSNHTLLLAQMYLNGDNYGMHPFLVQLRDIDTHQPLPGVTVMDLGPKSALDGNDNGILKLHNVRIPRENLMMKFAKVLEDGSYERPEMDKLQYASMINIRAGLPSMAANSLGMGCTIAIRYSCVRRQSEIKPGDSEVQVLDFVTQQAKLFPLLATAYAYWFIGDYVRNRHEEVVAFINKGNFDALNEHHALLAGLKGYCTSRAASGIELCRLACGGHGFSLASGLPQLFTTIAGAVTAEGEHTVMLLQTAKNLQKNYNWILEGKDANPLTQYLKKWQSLTTKFSGKYDVRELLEALEHRAWRMVKMSSDRVRKLSSGPNKLDKHDAWNAGTVLFIKASVAHCEVIIARAFIQKVASLAATSPVRAAIDTLCRLYTVGLVVDNAGDFLEDGYMTSEHIDELQRQRIDLYTTVRRDAVAYVDAFQFPDKSLNSVLGRYDGNVYENLYKWAQKSPLNRKEVHEAHTKYIKSLQSAKL